MVCLVGWLGIAGWPNVLYHYQSKNGAQVRACRAEVRSPLFASSSSCYRASDPWYIGVIMSSRIAVLSFLSVICLACILYFTIIPQGPQLLWYPEFVLDISTSSEMTTRAEKFTPEYAYAYTICKQEQCS